MGKQSQFLDIFNFQIMIAMTFPWHLSVFTQGYFKNILGKALDLFNSLEIEGIHVIVRKNYYSFFQSRYWGKLSKSNVSGNLLNASNFSDCVFKL